MVGVNVGRSIGPALAGVVIAVGAVWHVFALNALSVVFLAVVLLVWKRQPPPGPRPTRERFVPALRAGARYVRHEPVVRRILLRVIFFIVPASAMWALLPLRRSGSGSGSSTRVVTARCSAPSGVGAVPCRPRRGPAAGQAVHQRLAGDLGGVLRGRPGRGRRGRRSSSWPLGGPGRGRDGLGGGDLHPDRASCRSSCRAGSAPGPWPSSPWSSSRVPRPWPRWSGVRSPTWCGVLWTFVAVPRWCVVGTLAGAGLAAAGDRSPEQRGRHLLARCPAGRRAAPVDRAGADHGHLHRRRRPAGGIPGRHAGAPSLPPAQRLHPVGALPRRRVPRPLRRGLPGRRPGRSTCASTRAGSPAPTSRSRRPRWRSPTRRRPPSTTCHRRSCRERCSRSGRSAPRCHRERVGRVPGISAIGASLQVG